jgi:hypothetical protein
MHTQEEEAMQFRRHVSILGWVLILTFGFLIVVGAQASSSLAGTWRLNVAKSKWSPGPGNTSNTTRYDVTQTGIKATTDSVNAQGHKLHTEFACSFDGKDCPDQLITVDGKPSSDFNVAATTLSWKRIDDYTYEYTTKIKGQTLTTTRIVVAKDGKMQTRTTTGKNAQGRTVNNVVVWEKQ